MSSYSFKINHHPAVALSEYHKDKLINEHHLNKHFNNRLKLIFFNLLEIKLQNDYYHEGIAVLTHPLAQPQMVEIYFGGTEVLSCKNESFVIAKEIYDFITNFLTIEKCLSK